MVARARARELAEVRAVCAYLGYPESTIRDYLKATGGDR